MIGVDQALLREQGLELAGLEHLAHDVRTADQFALHIELRDGRPVGKHLDPLAQVVVLQHVDADERNAEVVENLHGHRGEPAPRVLRLALHEQHHGVVLDGVADEGLHRVAGVDGFVRAGAGGFELGDVGHGDLLMRCTKARRARRCDQAAEN